MIVDKHEIIICMYIHCFYIAAKQQLNQPCCQQNGPRQKRYR